MPATNVNGIEIVYELEGDGEETIVLVNGLADTLEAWALQMDALLRAGYRVLRFDNRGVGRSATPEGPYTTALLAQDTKALVDELGLSDFHLLGVSMGGMIAQEYAIAHPEDLRSLILACTYAAPGPFCSRIFSLWADMAPELGVATLMREATLWAFTVPFFVEQTETLEEFESEMAAIDQPLEAFLAQLSSVRTHDTTDRIGALTVPTLVLAAEQDILIPVSLSRELHAAINGAQWVTTPGGHACLWESAESFNQVVLDFLNREHAPAGLR